MPEARLQRTREAYWETSVLCNVGPYLSQVVTVAEPFNDPSGVPFTYEITLASFPWDDDDDADR